MRLQMKCVDGEVIVYREKWGTLAFQLMLGVLSLAIAAYFYQIGASKAPTVFLVVFCGMFGLGGLSILLYLPRQAKKVWKNEGAHVIVANVGGITVTPNLGSRSSHFPWTKVSEVILVKFLTLVDADETTSLTRQVIVMLNHDAHRHGHWMNELGSGVSKSGEDRAFLLGDYPKAGREELVHVLRKLAPSSVPIRVLTNVTFNRKSRRDSYAEM